MGFGKVPQIVKRIGGKWVRVSDDATRKFLEDGKTYIKMDTITKPNGLQLKKTPNSDVFVSTITKETNIPPRVLPREMNTGTTIIKDYERFNNFEPYFAEFTDDVHPIIMKRIEPPLKKNIIHVSNFDPPYGTIAASSRLNECLFTDKIRDCAAIAIVDKTQNLQSLVHCFPGQSTKSNEEIIKYILSHSNPQNLEISIIPGINEDTGRTISFLADMVKKYAKEAKLNFLNFPRNKMGLGYRDERAILLSNGEIGFCRNFEIGSRIVNPTDKITYCQSL